MVQFNLDSQFISLLTPENVKNSFLDLKKRKMDIVDGNIKIAKGADGINYERFESNISFHSDIICSKGRAGKYLFTPFREVIIPKAPYERDQLDEAKKANKTRILSIATIQDTIFQELMSQVLIPFSEQKFIDTVDTNSFAYRKNKSSKMAVQLVRKYIRQGYIYVLDADIKKFFDEIDHALLLEKCDCFFGCQNALLLKFIKRYINVSRIPDGQLQLYRDTKKKEGCEKRLIGIPQGGVLSGLLANIFLFDFDKHIIQEITKKYDCKYVRYADDFVLMFKSNRNIEEVYKGLEAFLNAEKLVLHPIGEKTKIVHLKQKQKGKLNFLGFTITPNYLRVKQANVKKFNHRIKKLLEKIPAESTDKYLKEVVAKIKPKIIGLEDQIGEDGYCEKCGELLRKRNWIGYFMIIDDVRLLRNMDTHIRKMIYNDYHAKTERHLRKKELKQIEHDLLSLEKMYYKYKKQEKMIRSGKVKYCNCWRYYDKDLRRIVPVPQNASMTV